MSWWLVIHAGCGSWRMNLYQANTPTGIARITSTRRILSSRPFHPPSRPIAGSSEGLQVLEQRPLQIGRQQRAVGGTFVPRVPIARQAGVVAPSEAFGVVSARHKSQPLEVIHVVARVEDRRSPRAWIEKRRDGRHGAVVQVRRAQPQAVERLVRVAVCLAEVCETRRVALLA